MWSNVISLDKGYGREIEFLLAKLKNIRHLSYAVEESRDRVFIYMASVCEAHEEVERQVKELIVTVFLVFMKLRFFLEKLQNMDLNHANCALICSLVHFDRQYESNIVRKALSETVDFAVDGILHFRLRPLVEHRRHPRQAAQPHGAQTRGNHRTLRQAGAQPHLRDNPRAPLRDSAQGCFALRTHEQHPATHRQGGGGVRGAGALGCEND